MGPMFTDFWEMKSTHLGGTSLYIYICEDPSLAPLALVVGAPK